MYMGAVGLVCHPDHSDPYFIESAVCHLSRAGIFSSVSADAADPRIDKSQIEQYRLALEIWAKSEEQRGGK